MEENKLPDGWVWTNLEAITLRIGDVDHKMPSSVESGIPYISTKNFYGEHGINFDAAKRISYDDYFALSRKIKPDIGDILLSRYGTVGEVRKVSTNIEFQASYSIAIIKILPNSDFTNYLFYALKSKVVQEQIKRDIRATAQPDLGLEYIRKFEIPLAPLPEQQRIVAAIEQQFTRLDAGVAALKSAKTRLKRYRATVLKAAVEGKLTEAWRAEHPTSEPASQLLTRIIQERRAKWEADQRAKGKDPAKVKYVEPTAPDVSGLPELPKEWCWASLDSVADTIDPQPSHRTPASVEGGIPYIGIGDITQDGRINIDQVKKVSLDVFEEHQSRYQLKEGDFIFGKIGTIGRPVKLPQPFYYTLSANVVLIQPTSIFLNSSLTFIYMASPFLKKLLTEGSRATTQAAFGIQKVRLLPILIPPLEEQQQIVSEVERRLSLVSQLEALVEANLKRAERLRQSVLKEAFAGRLVPQDPDDEPASVLLERIRQERESAGHENNGRKQSKQQHTYGKKQELREHETFQEAYARNGITQEPEPLDENEIAQVALWNAD